MATYDVPYSFYGGNRAAILCRDPEVVLAGAAETGKTLAWLFKLHTLAYKYPGCQLAIVRKKKVDIVSTVFHTLKRDLLDDCGPGVRVYGGQYPQWIDYPGGSRIWMGGMDDPGKTLSAERDVIYVNQAEETSLSDWEFLTRCVTGRGAVMPYTQLVADANPGPPTHWIKQRSRPQNGNAPALTFFESTHKDNPTLWDRKRGEWTEQGKRSLGRLAKMTGTRLQRLYYGLWAAPEGAIYDIFESDLGEYGQKRHVVRSFPIPATWPRAVGIDPFGAQIAAVWLAFDPTSGILNVYREYLQPFGLTTEGHARNILAAGQGEPVFAWVCGGPSERAWRLEWQAAGIPVVEPPISDVWVGIDRVYQLWKEFRLVVHDNCVNFIGETGDYRRKIGRDGIATEKIENKDAFHLLDAARYVVAWLTEPKETTEVARLPWMRIA
jgi:phage terminase large subunit